MKVLNVQSSSNLAGSNSRAVSKEFIDALKKKHAGATIVDRDVTKEPISHLTPQILGALFAKPDQQTSEHKATLKVVDTLVDEVLAADLIVVGAPMYNFSVPSALKAWIDAVVRAGRTFNYTATGPVGTLGGKKCVFISSSGGVYSEGPAKAVDHLDPYLRAIFGFLGAKEFHSVRVEGTALGADKAAAAKAHAITQAQKIAASL